MKKINEATACLFRYCKENGFIYSQPNRQNLEEDDNFVYHYGDDGELIWKYDIAQDKLLFPKN